MTPLGNGVITLAGPADLITFSSPNYIAGVDFPPEVLTGTQATFNVSVTAPGNVTLEINSSTTMAYQSTEQGTGTVAFQWEVAPDTGAGLLSVSVFYFGNYEFGFFSGNLQVTTATVLSSSGINLPALALGVINAQYAGKYSGTNVDGANVTFSVSNYTGTLMTDAAGNYSAPLDLGTYALPPGIYSLQLAASKAGYQSCTNVVPLEVTPRPATITVTVQQAIAHVGDEILVDITVSDNITGTYLLRPADLNITLFSHGGDPARDAVFTHVYHGITSQTSISLPIPSSIALGKYDISVTVLNPFYAGSATVAGSLEVVAAPLTWQIAIIGVGASIICVGIYIHHEKQRTKRSVKGLMILLETGTPIAENISASISRLDPTLISGAISGMMTLMQEITGGGLRTIKVDWGYLELTRGRSFWTILFLHRNPGWIRPTIKRMMADIERRYGNDIKAWKGAHFPIPIEEILMKYFGVGIENEVPSPGIENVAGG